MDDLISRQAALDEVHRAVYEFFDICDDDEESPITYKDEKLLELNKAISIRIRQLPSADAVEKDVPAENGHAWIPVKTRPMTDEEKRYWEERTGEILVDEYATFFDCPMPDDGQQILTCSSRGDIAIDECVVDEFGTYLDTHDDWYGIVAWMPLPEPYKEE